MFQTSTQFPHLIWAPSRREPSPAERACEASSVAEQTKRMLLVTTSDALVSSFLFLPEVGLSVLLPSSDARSPVRSFLFVV